MTEVFQEPPLEVLVEILDRSDSKDEPMHIQKLREAEREAELEERLYRLAHPRDFIEALNNFSTELKNFKQATEYEEKDWEQLADEATHHSYFDGDKRGDGKQPSIHPAPTTTVKRDDITSDKPQYEFFTNILNLKRQKPSDAKSSDGLRCHWCKKVIRTSAGRNIHCTESLGKYICDYCGHVS